MVDYKVEGKGVTLGLGSQGGAQLPACLGGGDALIISDKLLIVHPLVSVQVSQVELLTCEPLDLCGLDAILQRATSYSLTHKGGGPGSHSTVSPVPKNCLCTGERCIQTSHRT